MPISLPVKEILEEQALLLPKLTGDIVIAHVRQWTNSEKLLTMHNNKDFVYSFLLIGKFLNNYSFKVFNFSHEITLYPALFEFDEQLADELGINYEIEVGDQEKVIDLLSKVLTSQRIKDIIGSIIKITSSK